MGWGSGSNLMIDLIDIVQRHITDDRKRMLFYEELIAAFEDNDCDTLGECLDIDPEFDRAYNRMHPDTGETSA